MGRLFLIVDDEPLVRDDILFTLSGGGLDCELLEAENGEKALEIALARRPDVLMIDIQMPRMNGLQVMEQLAAAGWRGVSIVISGYDDFRYAQQALKLGAMDYLLKPIDEEALLRVARRAVARVDEERSRREHAERGRRERMALWVESVYHRAVRGHDLSALRGELSPVGEPGERAWAERALGVGLVHVGAIGGRYTREEAGDHLLDVLKRLVEGVGGYAFQHHALGSRLVALAPAKCGEDARRALYAVAEELFSIAALSRKPLPDAYFAAAWGERADQLPALSAQCEDALCGRFSSPPGLLREASEARHAGRFCAPSPGEMLPAFEAFKRLAEGGGAPETIGRAALSLILPPGQRPCAAHAQAMFRMAASLVVGARFAERARARMRLADVPPQDMLDYLDSPDEVRAFFEELASGADGPAVSDPCGNVGDVVDKVRAWIDVGYGQPITLAEMGKRFFINQNYLSGAFKEAVGVKFIDYLTERRMEE
ncbi:MAG: response regulator, partial [Clostridiales bacterium]|nr:response regulator [Clostridiales bacterium]